MDFTIPDPNIKYKNGKPLSGIIDENGCFICKSHSPMTQGKYYLIKRNGKSILAHRYVYELYYGEIDNGLYVRHKCDNVFCINPDHLELGTHQDNMNDMKDRGRSLKGDLNPSIKLSKEDVAVVKSLLLEGILSQSEIARKFNVSHTLIYLIKNEKFHK